MPEPKIIFAPVLDPEVRAIGEGLVPKGFSLEWTAHTDVPQASVASMPTSAFNTCGARKSWAMYVAVVVGVGALDSVHSPGSWSTSMTGAGTPSTAVHVSVC